jgi:hypothetical protein
LPVENRLTQTRQATAMRSVQAIVRGQTAEHALS